MKKIGRIVRIIITDINELASFALEVSVPIRTHNDVNRKYDTISRMPYSKISTGSKLIVILNGIALYFCATK